MEGQGVEWVMDMVLDMVMEECHRRLATTPRPPPTTRLPTTTTVTTTATAAAGARPTIASATADAAAAETAVVPRSEREIRVSTADGQRGDKAADIEPAATTISTIAAVRSRKNGISLSSLSSLATRSNREPTATLTRGQVCEGWLAACCCRYRWHAPNKHRRHKQLSSPPLCPSAVRPLLHGIRPQTVYTDSFDDGNCWPGVVEEVKECGKCLAHLYSMATSDFGTFVRRVLS